MSVAGSQAGSINTLQIARQVAVSANGGDATGIQAPTDPNEIQQLSLVIRTWRELVKETDELAAQVREKKKRMKALEEMILRIMKKNNIGALDLQSSGGRLLYRRQTTKGSLGQKDLARLLGEHLKSDQKATEALQYIANNRGSRVKESLMYEKD
jgi:transcriptional accessory protein Tex/SPT6